MDTRTGIPMQTLIDMAYILYKGVQEAVKDPEFMEEFEKWKEERKSIASILEKGG